MIRSVLIVVILGLLAGCSTVKLGYNSADKLLAYRLDDWFDLHEEIREPARERLRRVLAWHRREELPRYARIFQAAERRLEDPAPLRTSELLALQQDVAERLLELGNRVADEFSDVLTQFGPAQRRRLLTRLAEGNEEFREEYLLAGEAAVRKRRVGQMVERYGFWLGRVTPDQRAAIERWVEAHPAEASWRLGLRETRQRTFVGIIDEGGRRQSPSWVSARLRTFFSELHTPAAEEVRRRQEQWEHARARLTADLFNMATPVQREKARERLRRLRDDVLDLAGQAGAL